MAASDIRIVHAQTESSRWELAIGLGAPRFAGLVHRAVGYTECSAGPTTHRALPSSKVIVVFELGDPVRVAERDDGRQLTRFRGGFVAGLDDVTGLAAHDGRQSGLRVELTPEAARRVFGIPMSELSGRIVSLPDLLPRIHRDLVVRLRTMTTWQARFAALTDLFSEPLSGDGTGHAGVCWATNRIQESGGIIDIGELVRSLGYSHKHTLRLFREHVGLTPKVFARLVRFERVRQAIVQHGQGRLAELAARFGYSDQAHLVHEVRHFAGSAPSSLGSDIDLLAQYGC